MVAAAVLAPSAVHADSDREKEIEALVKRSQERVENVKKGIRDITAEVKKLEESRVERLTKLQRDMSAMRAYGTAGIPEDNMFYLTRVTGLTPYELDSCLEGTPMEGLGEDFYRAEHEYGVNAIFLIALANHESAYGTSAIARDKNNLFGFTAYDSSPYSSSTGYSSKGESIAMVARFLSENYLTPGGCYFHGVSCAGVNVKYCTSSDWAGKVENHMLRVAGIICDKMQY